MSFFENIGNLRKTIYGPMAEQNLELQYKYKNKAMDEQLARQQAAIEIFANLERQRGIAADYAKQPLAEDMHGVRPEWDQVDEVRRYQSLGQAGVDPEAMAKAQKAQLMYELLEKGAAGIDNPVMQANLGLGKELNPVQLKEGNYFNAYDTENFQLGTTEENQQDVQLKTSKADEQEQRLAMINNLPNEIMRLNAYNNRELGKPIEGVIETADGQSQHAIISQDTSGNYHYAGVNDKAGNPMIIPAEAVDGGSGLTTDQKNVAFYSQLWKKTPAETAEILKSKSMFTDAGFIESRLTANSEGRWGRADDDTIFTQTFDDFTRARYGSEFPDYFIQLAKNSDMKDDKKDAFIKKVDDYNQTVFEMKLAGGVSPQPPVQPVAPPTVQAPPVQPVAPPTVQAPPVQPVAPPAPIPAPAAPLPIPEAPPMDFNQFAETVMAYNSPAEVNAALKKQGVDMSPANMSAMAIDAINLGEDPADIQQLFQLLGINWTPPA